MDLRGRVDYTMYYLFTNVKSRGSYCGNFSLIHQVILGSTLENLPVVHCNSMFHFIHI